MAPQVHHVALTVSDLNKSIVFYQELFGFRKSRTWKRPQQGLRAVVLESNRQKIELIKSQHPKPLPPGVSELRQIGLKHIAFSVTNIEEVFKKAIELGGKEIWPVQKGTSRNKIAFVADPNGIPIELIEHEKI